MSNYSYERALLLGLLGQGLSATEKEEFKHEVQRQLGLVPGQECDKICGAMSDEEFRYFVKRVREALMRRKKQKADFEKERQLIYA